MEAQLQALCSPCYLEFTVCIKLQRKCGENGSLKKRRRKRSGKVEESEEDEEEGVCLELDRISGDRELLHQLLQYFKNKMTSNYFNS